MVSTFAEAVANVILESLFIFDFHWGMMGAAVATVIVLTCRELNGKRDGKRTLEDV